MKECDSVTGQLFEIDKKNNEILPETGKNNQYDVNVRHNLLNFVQTQP